jgi:hypothetical protein
MVGGHGSNARPQTVDGRVEVLRSAVGQVLGQGRGIGGGQPDRLPAGRDARVQIGQRAEASNLT